MNGQYERCAVCGGWISTTATNHVRAVTVDNVEVVLHHVPCYTHSEAEYKEVKEVFPRHQQRRVT